MTDRATKTKLVVFTVLGITGIVLIFVSYIPVPQMLGYDRMTVTARFSQAGNLYPSANVLYRGVPIGTVTAVKLAAGGVDVKMSIDDSYRIPTNVGATIHNTSAIGDKYVGLAPQTVGGPFLEDGAVIPSDRTSVPVSTARVLQDVDELLTSVPKGSLSVVLREVKTAFQGLGPDLRTLATSAGDLVAAGERNIGPTKRLLDDLGPALRTQQVTSDEIRSLTRDLASFSEQLRRSDPTLEGVLEDLPPAAQRADRLLRQLTTTTPRLLDSTSALTHLLKAYNQPLEHTLVVFPMVASMLMTSAVDDYGFGLNFDLVQNYPSCTTGWTPPDEPGGARAYTAISDAPLPKETYCKLPQDSQRVVRGARNLPCFEPGSPPGRRAATIEQCRGEGYEPAGTEPPLAFPGGSLGGKPLTGPPLDLAGPILQGRDPVEPLSTIGGTATKTERDETKSWQSLLLGAANE